MDLSKVLKDISPSEEEATLVKSVTSEIKKKLESSAKHNSVSVDVVPGGSTAKGTFLKGDYDVDIFVRFKDNLENISDTLEIFLTDLDVVFERIHGSRDYFSFTYKDFFFEIVPVKYIEDKSLVENITDMSPLHVIWVKKHLTKKLQEDIRLAKQFCKACGVYGAESYINGFSGHVLDILVIYYGGFEKFLFEASKWSEIAIVDIDHKHKDVFTSLNQSKLVSPLIVIDPIDSQRNAAAAVSSEKYKDFIAAAKAYVEKPSLDFFTVKPFDIKKIDRGDNADLFVVKVVPQIGKKDVVATKVLKVFEFLQRHLLLHDFEVHDTGWHYTPEEATLYFVIDKNDLDVSMVRQGPPLSNEVGAKRFREVHHDAYEKDGRLYAYVKREFVNAEKCLNHLLGQDFVKERVAEVSMSKE